MIRINPVRIVVCITSLLLLGGTALADSPDEAEIKGLFKEFAGYYNNSDAEKVISCYHQDAKIRTGWPGKIVTKEEYRAILPGRMKKNERMSFYDFQIDQKGDRAGVMVRWRIRQNLALKADFGLLKSNGRWLIIKQDYKMP